MHDVRTERQTTQHVTNVGRDNSIVTQAIHVRIRDNPVDEVDEVVVWWLIIAQVEISLTVTMIDSVDLHQYTVVRQLEEHVDMMMNSIWWEVYLLIAKIIDDVRI